MSTTFALLERRLTVLESSARRWRATSIALGGAFLIAMMSGFQQQPITQSLEVERITFRSARNVRNTAVHLELAPDGALLIQFGDTLHRAWPELRILNASGQKVARLGVPGSWLSNR